LGRAASVLVANNKAGYMVTVNNIQKPIAEWKAQAIPLAGMMAVEERKGKEVLVITKYLVNLNSKAFFELRFLKLFFCLQRCFSLQVTIKITFSKNFF
jgi:6-phosphofructokinase